MRQVTLLSTAILFALFGATISYATPSTTFWTPCSMDIQAFGVLHAGADNYFSLKNDGKDPVKDLPTDVGLTIGVLPFDKVQLELGVDALYPKDANNAPFYYNGKIGSPEDSFFKFQPAIGAGVFNAGTKKDKTDYNIGYGVIGKSIPYLGRFTFGYYSGNDKLLTDEKGKKANTGYMAAWDHSFFHVGGEKDGYDKIILAADYASGDNAFGGYGGGIYYFFSKDASLLVGPTWFKRKDINGKMKISVQFDGNINIFGS